MAEVTDTTCLKHAVPWRQCLAVGLVLVLALVLRAYRLSEQSVWFDEQTAFGHVTEPTFGAYWAQVWNDSPGMAPLYFVLQYYWSWLVDGSIVAVRWLSIVFGLLAVPMLYLFGRHLFGHRAGLLAALCLALSPFHIYHAQGIRNYSLTALLGLCSAYAFVRALDSERRGWWTVNLAANLLLMWTHLMGAWLLAAEGVFLLFHVRRFRRTVIWGAAHALLLIPLGLFVLTLKDTGPTEAATPLSRVIPMLMEHLYRVDVNQPLSFRPSGLLQHLALLGYQLGVVRCPYVFPVFCVMALIGARRADAEGGPSAAAKASRFQQTLFLLLWHVLPAVLLLGFAMALGVGLLETRYTIYSTFALYLLLGGGVAAFRRPWLRRALALFLVGLFASQAGLFLAKPRRVDYQAAARHLRAHALPDDVLLIHPGFLSVVFQMNQKPGERRLQPAETLADVLLRVEQAHDSWHDAWVVLVETPEVQARNGVAQCDWYFATRGFTATHRVFPGPNALHVYGLPAGRVPRLAALRDGASLYDRRVLDGCREALEHAPDVVTFSFVLGEALAKQDRLEEALRAYARCFEAAAASIDDLRRLNEREPTDASANYLRNNLIAILGQYAYRAVQASCGRLVAAQRREEAIDLARRACERLPNVENLHWEYARLLEIAGRAEEDGT